MFENFHWEPSDPAPTYSAHLPCIKMQNIKPTPVAQMPHQVHMAHLSLVTYQAFACKTSLITSKMLSTLLQDIMSTKVLPSSEENIFKMQSAILKNR